MKRSLLHRLHIAILALLGVWALVCLAALSLTHTVMYVAMALGPLVSYSIAAWIIGQLRREVTR